MDILLTALEIAPYVVETPAAESVSSLAKALRLLGHEVTVAVPKRSAYERAGLMAARRLTPLRLERAGELEPAGEAVVYDGQLPSGVRIVLLDAEGMDFESPKGGPASEARKSLRAENVRSLSLFAQSVAALVREGVEHGSPYEVVHAHDYGAGLSLLELKRETSLASGMVLTIHDASDPGLVDAEDVGEARIPAELASHYGFATDGGISLLKGLLAVAQKVIVPSEAYGRQLQTPERFGGLARAFAQAAPIGIREGVDHAVYNPATDPSLPARFDGGDPSHKGTNKTRIETELELEPEVTRPLFLVEDVPGGASALETVVAAVPALMRLEMSVVIHGQTEPSEQQRAVLEEFPERVRWVSQLGARERRRLLAGVDCYLCVQRKNPSAQALLQAQRYGALCVAYAVDSVEDAVVDLDAELQTGTGILFDSMTQRAVENACARAVAAYRNPRHAAVLRRIMRQDLAWDGPTRRYVQVYRQVIAAA